MRRLATLGFVIAATAVTLAAQSGFTITTTSLPPATSGQPYPNVVLQTTGDPGPMNWSIDGPFGFTVGPGSNTTGLFCYANCSGIIVQTVPGQYSATIIATSQTTGAQAFQNFTVFVVQQLQIITTSLPNATAGQSYSTQMQSIGGSGNLVWSILNGSLPPGIALDAFKGVLAGTAPAVNGTYPFTVQLLDQVTGTKALQSLSITIVGGITQVTITTTALPDAIVNQSYSFQLTATGANLVWSLTTGSVLPTGFSLSPGGLLTGVGLGPGLFTIPVQVMNAQAPSASASASFPLAITLGPLSIVEQSLPAAHQNVPYATNLTPSGGIPPYTWGIGVGSPQGLSIGSTSGIISGTLTTGGTFPVQVSLRDSRGVTVSQTFTLNVGNGVAITTTSLPNSAPSVPYSATLTATGGELTYKWNVVSGILPTGLSLDQASGLISGTPTAQGAFQFTVQVTDFVGGTDRKTFVVTIGSVQPLTITTTSLPGASRNQPYPQQILVATGGTQPVTWSITSGSLPTGLTLNPSTGAITGTPTAIEFATFTVRALDSASAIVSKSFTITVASAVTISATGFTASVGVAVSQTVTAGGGAPPYAFSVSVGSLPGGLQLDASTGAIGGTPNATGSFPVTLRATDSGGRFAEGTITITVNSLPLTIVIPASPGSNQQPGVAVTIPAPATGDLNGTLALAFASSVGGDDKMVRFAPSGSRSVAFTIPKGSTTAPNAAIITGTVAGTITLTASVPGSPDVIRTIVIDAAAPVITSVTLQQTTGGVTVLVSGYSNTREVSSGSFTFTVSSSTPAVLAPVTVQLTSAYAAWFGGTASNDFGGLFKLTVPFSVTQGSAASLTKVSVTLTNSKGASAAVSSP